LAVVTEAVGVQVEVGAEEALQCTANGRAVEDTPDGGQPGEDVITGIAL
jgi:hypothetical protein